MALDDSDSHSGIRMTIVYLDADAVLLRLRPEGADRDRAPLGWRGAPGAVARPARAGVLRPRDWHRRLPWPRARRRSRLLAAARRCTRRGRICRRGRPARPIA